MLQERISEGEDKRGRGKARKVSSRSEDSRALTVHTIINMLNKL